MAEFASTDDVQARLGRDLRGEEEAAASLVLEVVTGLIADAVGADEDWAEGLDPVPAYFRALCIEKSVGALVNPSNAASWSERLGMYQRSETYPRASDMGIFLSEYEEQMAKRIAKIPASGSSRPDSILADAPAAE